jgi:hypothetical protein
MYGASGFLLVYFRLSVCFIMLLHVLMVVRIAFCCCFVWSLFNFVYLLVATNLSIFRLHSFLSIIIEVFPLSAFVTVRLFCLIFFFMLMMSLFLCYSRLNNNK